MVLAADRKQNPSGKLVRSQYGFCITPATKRISAVFNGETIVDSRNAVVLSETRQPPVYYFPRNDVRMDLLQLTGHHTHCAFKGNATYWTIRVGDRAADDAVWSYEHPIKNAEDIKEYLAITWNSMDAWYEDGERVYEQSVDGGSVDANPFSGWLIQAAWCANSSQALVRELAEMMVRNGVPGELVRPPHDPIAGRRS